MSRESSDPAACPRSWLGIHHDRYEARTRWVVALTLVTMVAEIAGGYWYGSMALAADGWHMATHAAALGVAALAYRYARVHANDPRFSFGTGKVGELAGFGSAVSLAIVALLIAAESFGRLVAPRAIDFHQATVIAVVGLAVNLVSAWLLAGGPHGHHHDHAHHPHHDDDDDHHHAHAPGSLAAPPAVARDTNLHAAYVHVLTDALTSVLAIAGLLAGRWFGWVWMDAVAGLAGAAIIMKWSVGLARQAGRSLLDSHDDSELERAALERLQRATEDGAITDMHLWRLGPDQYALLATLRGPRLSTPDGYREALRDLPQLRHVTVEVNITGGREAPPAPAGLSGTG
jgi:cation diffusion facilitator family transporter